MYLNYLEKTEFENVMLESLREIHDVTQKVLVSTLCLIFLADDKLTAELLYSENDLEYFMERGNKYFKELEINDKSFDENLFEYYKNENLDSAFLKTVEILKKKIEMQDKGYFKCLFEKDDWALATAEASEFFINLYSTSKLTASNIKQFARFLKKQEENHQINTTNL